jgi:hypothetical protein
VRQLCLKSRGGRRDLGWQANQAPRVHEARFSIFTLEIHPGAVKKWPQKTYYALELASCEFLVRPSQVAAICPPGRGLLSDGKTCRLANALDSNLKAAQLGTNSTPTRAADRDGEALFPESVADESLSTILETQDDLAEQVRPGSCRRRQRRPDRNAR